MVANPTFGQSAELEKYCFTCPRSRLSIWSRERGSDVLSRVSSLFLHTEAESGAYSRDSSRNYPTLHYISPPNTRGGSMIVAEKISDKDALLSLKMFRNTPAQRLAAFVCLLIFASSPRRNPALSCC